MRNLLETLWSGFFFSSFIDFFFFNETYDIISREALEELTNKD